MKSNRFYRLPEDILCLIYKKYYSVHVLNQLVTRPGNFAGIMDDSNWTFQLQRDYRIIDKIPGAWDFLKNTEDDFIMNADRRNRIFKCITNCIANDSIHTGFSINCSLNLLQFIAKNGWDYFYKKQNTLTFKNNIVQK